MFTADYSTNVVRKVRMPLAVVLDSVQLAFSTVIELSCFVLPALPTIPELHLLVQLKPCLITPTFAGACELQIKGAQSRPQEAAPCTCCGQGIEAPVAGLGGAAAQRKRWRQWEGGNGAGGNGGDDGNSNGDAEPE
jgi:hypothetical protein